MSGKKIIAFIPAGISFLLAAGTMTVFRACGAKEDGQWMHCHTAQNAAAAGGLLLCILFLSCLFIRSSKLRIALSVIGIVGAAAVFMIPGGIVSMCMKQTMRCYVVMQPFVRVMSVLIIVAALISVFQNRSNAQ